MEYLLYFFREECRSKSGSWPSQFWDASPLNNPTFLENAPSPPLLGPHVVCASNTGYCRSCEVVKSFTISQATTKGCSCARMGRRAWERLARLQDSGSLQKHSWHSQLGAGAALGGELVRSFPASGR